MSDIMTSSCDKSHQFKLWHAKRHIIIRLSVFLIDQSVNWHMGPGFFIQNFEFWLFCLGQISHAEVTKWTKEWHFYSYKSSRLLYCSVCINWKKQVWSGFKLFPVTLKSCALCFHACNCPLQVVTGHDVYLEGEWVMGGGCWGWGVGQ